MRGFQSSIDAEEESRQISKLQRKVMPMASLDIIAFPELYGTCIWKQRDVPQLFMPDLSGSTSASI
ncbi:hypothetical protein F2Q68_00017350 [Brassica cretica]|uniref:Uncharacterized protein n=2 Tax=Brassica cretica TaxID=69181 RepID=A0ABQ7EVJ4_BRACR|nr:hypothetical protein F2Q68_00017350 [Brassica cretica]KAF3607567.1 hypothetical protein DY000_02050062 [Brassica cretica]